MRVPVRLGIKEEKGTFRTLVAWTLVLSKHGARIESKQALNVNQEVIVTVLLGAATFRAAPWHEKR